MANFAVVYGEVRAKNEYLAVAASREIRKRPGPYSFLGKAHHTLGMSFGDQWRFCSKVYHDLRIFIQRVFVILVTCLDIFPVIQ